MILAGRRKVRLPKASGKCAVYILLVIASATMFSGCLYGLQFLYVRRGSGGGYALCQVMPKWRPVRKKPEHPPDTERVSLMQITGPFSGNPPSWSCSGIRSCDGPIVAGQLWSPHWGHMPSKLRFPSRHDLFPLYHCHDDALPSDPGSTVYHPELGLLGTRLAVSFRVFSTFGVFF